MRRSGLVKFQVYTDDGRWVGTHQIDNSSFEYIDDYDDWDWRLFFEYILSLVKEYNEGTH